MENRNEENVPRENEDPKNQEIYFYSIPDPAPEGKECMLYLVRQVHCVQKSPFLEIGSTFNAFHGSLNAGKDLLSLNFYLRRSLTDDEYCDLEISEVEVDQSLKPMSLAGFQQAEFCFQFFKLVNTSGDNVDLQKFHEEPPMQLSLNLPHWKKERESWTRGRAFHLKNEVFTLTCLNVIPFKNLDEHILQKGQRKLIIMRIYMKLIKGELDALHGIQKYFHPDKDLYDLREKMKAMLVEGTNSDMVVVSADQKRYKAHRSVLAANSLMVKSMFASDMKEAKSGVAQTPPFVKSKTLEAVLKYIYARNRKDLEDDPVLTTDVLQAAHYYQIEQLEQICTESLLAMPLSAYNLDSALYLFQVAVLLDSKSLQTNAVHTIMLMNVTFTDSKPYLKFLETHSEMAAKLMQMVMQFTREFQENK